MELFRRLKHFELVRRSCFCSVTGRPLADSSGRQRHRVRQELPVLHDDEDVKPALPARDLHKGDDHQLHRHKTGAGGPVVEVSWKRLMCISYSTFLLCSKLTRRGQYWHDLRVMRLIQPPIWRARFCTRNTSGLVIRSLLFLINVLTNERRYTDTYG